MPNPTILDADRTAIYQRSAKHYEGQQIDRSDGTPGRFTGTAIVFNALSVDLGGFREQIAPEAVDRTLTEAIAVRALLDHDPGKVLANTAAGTLALRKTTAGLRAVIDADPEISYVADALRSVRRGDIDGMSFGFRILDDDWNFDGPIPIRTVLDMRIMEVSIVAFPAYVQTNVDAAQRSLRAAAARAGIMSTTLARRRLQQVLAGAPVRVPR
jgi:Escherichia/Staphylococcus phage prohead protease